MGKVYSVVVRSIKNINIESRAHKIISQEKPTPAPRYTSNIKELEEVLRQNPNIIEEQQKKNTKLDDRLKNVYVTSEDPPPEIRRTYSSDRMLPLDRTQVEEFEFGIKEPDRVPEGKATLRQIIKFMDEHQMNPTLWTTDKISKDYKLKHIDTANILKYYRLYQVYIPKERKVKTLFAGPKNIKQIDDKPEQKTEEKTN